MSDRVPRQSFLLPDIGEYRGGRRPLQEIGSFFFWREKHSKSRLPALTCTL